MKRRPSDKHETLHKWLDYLESRPQAEPVAAGDLARITRLLMAEIGMSKSVARSASQGAAAALYVANLDR